MNIQENELADKAAKLEINELIIQSDKIVSIAYLKRKVKESCYEKWIDLFNKSRSASNNYYAQFENKSKWKANSMKIQKKWFSTYIQLKTGHEYFRLYLSKKLDEYESNLCYNCL